METLLIDARNSVVVKKIAYMRARGRLHKVMELLDDIQQDLPLVMDHDESLSAIAYDVTERLLINLLLCKPS
jgi:phosphoribosyl-dephospho-CoA transferase